MKCSKTPKSSDMCQANNSPLRGLASGSMDLGPYPLVWDRPVKMNCNKNHPCPLPIHPEELAALLAWELCKRGASEGTTGLALPNSHHSLQYSAGRVQLEASEDMVLGPEPRFFYSLSEE